MQRYHNTGRDRLGGIERDGPTSPAVISEYDQHDFNDDGDDGDDRNDFNDRDHTSRRYTADEQQREWGKQGERTRLRYFDGGAAMYTWQPGASSAWERWSHPDAHADTPANVTGQSLEPSGSQK